MKIIPIISFLAVFLLLAIANQAAAAPVITSYSSTGGTTRNKDNEQDIMYLVTQGDALTFTVEADQPVSYEWAVNKSTEAGQVGTTPASSDTFNWTVPNEKGIWEIHLRSWNDLNEETHKEWVVSTLDVSEAPDFIDYFSDQKLSSRQENDPWNRQLPEWKVLFAATHNGSAINGYAQTDNSTEKDAYISTNFLAGKNIARGTFKFRLYMHDAGDVNSWDSFGSFSIMNNSLQDTGVHEGLRLENAYDEHLWLDGHDSGNGVYFTATEGNGWSVNEYAVNTSGVKTSAGWHDYMIIIDGNDEIYGYMDEQKIFSQRGHMDRAKWNAWVFNYIQIIMRDVADRYQYFDGIEVYKDRYLFPKSRIYFNSATGEIVLEKGDPAKDITLMQIHTALSDDSLFAYSSDNNTFVSYKPILVERGSSLRIENTAFVPNGYIYLKNASNFYISNSTLTAGTPYILKYTGYKLPDWPVPGDFILRTGAQSIIIKNSTINNASFTDSMSPYIFDIENTSFTNMKSDFVFGQTAEMFFMYKFNFSNNTFDGNVKFHNINQCFSQQYTARNEYLTFLNNSFNGIAIYADNTASFESKVNLKNSKYSSISLAEKNNAIGEITVSYYVDVLVVDEAGNPVNDATINVVNDVDVNVKSMNLQEGQRWSLIEKGNRYWERRYYKNDILSATTTGTDGHTPLPKRNESSTLVLMVLQKNSAGERKMIYTITAEKDGKTASLTGLDMDESWYRQNPNQPTKTVVLNIDTGAGYVETNYTIDLDQNGVINILDIVLVAQHFGETTTSPYPSYDINSDGSVDILDIRLVAEGM